MSEQAEETPITDLLRGVPADHRTEWEIQWDESGNATGHSMCPIGHLAHRAADLIESLQQENKELAEDYERLKVTSKAVAKVADRETAEVKRLRKAIKEVDESLLPYIDESGEIRIPLHKYAILTRALSDQEADKT